MAGQSSRDPKPICRKRRSSNPWWVDLHPITNEPENAAGNTGNTENKKWLSQESEFRREMWSADLQVRVMIVSGPGGPRSDDALPVLPTQSRPHPTGNMKNGQRKRRKGRELFHLLRGPSRGRDASLTDSLEGRQKGQKLEEPRQKGIG